MANTQKLSSYLHEASKSINAEGVDDEERVSILIECDNLRRKLERPIETAQRLSKASFQFVALRIAVDMGIFDAADRLIAAGKELHLDDLASEIPAEPLFVVRIMRFLTPLNIFTDKGNGIYTVTSNTRDYSTTSYVSEMITSWGAGVESGCALPSYFKKTGYRCPTDPNDCCFHHIKHTKQSWWEWLSTQPELHRKFHMSMTVYTTRLWKMRGMRWFEIFPIQTKLRLESDSQPLLVDVAGSKGQNIVMFKRHFPELPGRLILLERPDVIAKAVDQLPEEIECIGHDIFDPMPIKNAKAYFLSMIIHNWPDEFAVRILSNIKDAMGPTSILIIFENIIPERDAPLSVAMLDMWVMSNLAGMGRTEAQHKQLLERAGLTLVKSWGPENARNDETLRLLEVVRKDFTCSAVGDE